MSTPFPLDSASSSSTVAGQRAAGRGASWLREPLLLFLAAGGLLFALDRVLNPPDANHRIVIGADVDEQARKTFMDNRGREPTAEELAALRQIWIDNEVLYREGLALQADRGDDMIRQRVIFKSLSIVDAGVKLPEIDDAKLRGWFEAHRGKYDEPARYTFQEGVPVGERDEASIRAFVNLLNNDPPGEIKADLRIFRGRPLSNLNDSYGSDFARALDEMPRESGRSDAWRAVRSREGWHAIRVEEITPQKPAQFAALRGVVLQDWRDATAAEMRTAEVRKLGSKYKIVVEPGKP